MKISVFRVDESILVISEQGREDVIYEMDEQRRHCSESDAHNDIDTNDPRLISESVRVNPYGDAYEPLSTVAIIPHDDWQSLFR